MLEMTARLFPSPLDQRRGIVRMHPDALTALGLSVWDLVSLTGTRTTGGMVALAPPGRGQHELLCDELVLGNMGVPDGGTVQVERVPDREAGSVTVNASHDVLASVSPEILRTALLGKVMTAGDQVSLLDTIEDTAEPHPAAALDETETREALADAISRLPEREKLVVTLYYYEELTLREIGEVLGVTESRVSQLHTKAILRLKAKLQGSLERASLERNR